MSFLVFVGDHFDRMFHAVTILQRQTFVPNRTELVEPLHGRYACLLVFQETNFPEFFSQEVFGRIVEKRRQEWIDVGDLVSGRVEYQNSIMGRFEKATKTRFRVFQFGSCPPLICNIHVADDDARVSVSHALRMHRVPLVSAGSRAGILGNELSARTVQDFFQPFYRCQNMRCAFGDGVAAEIKIVETDRRSIQGTAVFNRQ